VRIIEHSVELVANWNLIEVRRGLVHEWVAQHAAFRVAV
jgi:hypothetical protein